MKLQFAGEIGVMALGVIKNVRPWYELSFLYGQTPRTVSKTREIETYSFKQNFFFFDHNLDGMRTRLYGSLNLYHVTGLRHQTSKFRDAPQGYYPINSLRALLALGVEIAQFERQNYRYFFEMGMNDVWITNHLNNKSLDYKNHVSMAMGIKFLF